MIVKWRLIRGKRVTTEFAENAEEERTASGSRMADRREHCSVVPKREMSVVIWAGLSLNPHPFKTKRVRHPTAETAMGFLAS
jgi:hypothetical protein